MKQSSFSEGGDVTDSILQKKQNLPEQRFRWSSYWVYIMYAIICSSGTHSFTIMASRSLHKNEANMVQFFISYIIYGLPLLYMQVVIGQYTQMGIIFFKHLSPIGHGLCYSYILNLFLRSIEGGLLISGYVLYLLTSTRYTLQWLVCPPEFANCWSKSKSSNCTRNCLENNNMSAYIYYITKYLDVPVLEIKDTRLSMPPFQKVLPLVFGWFMIIVCLIYATSNLRKVMAVLLYISLILLFILLCGSLVTKGGFQFFEEVARLGSKSWISLSAWSSSIDGTTSLLALGRPFHIVSGSYLAPTASSGILSVIAVALNFTMSFFCTVISFACYNILKTGTFTDNKFAGKLPNTDELIIMAVIPQALSLMGAAQFWSIVYFTFCLVSQSNNQIIHLITIERCLCDAYPKLSRYRKYVQSFICFFSFVTGLALIDKGMYTLYHVFLSAIYAAAIINSLATSILISWVYGVQRLCDDIHYLGGSQPSKFWEIYWYILPIILIVTFCIQSRDYVQDQDITTLLIYFTMILLFISPILFYSTLETFKYIKRRNLLGLFKPTEFFGPPDSEERRLRKLYNPRSEIKCRRRNDKCQHRCLLGNRHLQHIIQDSQESDSIITGCSSNQFTLRGSDSTIDNEFM